MIEAVNIRYRVGATVILDDVRLSITPGTVTTILGPNGAGKSTLLKCLTGALQPEAGRIVLDGTPLDAYSLAALSRKRAVLSQSSFVNFPFSVLEIVMMGRSPYIGSQATGSDAVVIREVLENVDAWHLQQRIFPTLSGGEQQRVHLARVLAQMWDRQHAYLFLDEPTTALDLKHQHQILRLTRRIAQERNTAVCLILHDLNLAMQYADQGVLMQDGRVVASGAIREVLTPRNIANVFEVPAQAVFGDTMPNGLFTPA